MLRQENEIHPPRVSIGLPVYNGENFIQETLDSLLAQTFQNFELIICDNASTDRTETICREYATKDKRIRYYRNSENLGAAKNYNRTFELSTGQYFKWAAHDDLCAPEFLERCVEILDTCPSVILCYPQEHWIDDKGNIIKTNSDLLNLRSPKVTQRFKQYHDIWYQRGYMPAMVFGLIRANELNKTKLIEEYVWADLPLCAELALRGEFYEIPEYLFFYRYHSQTSRALRKKSGNSSVLTWYNPNKKKAIAMLNWNLLLQYIKVINRVPLNLYEKVYCYFQMGRWASWKWKKLIWELVRTTIQLQSIYFQVIKEKIHPKTIRS